MKKKTSIFVKNIISAISSIVKGKADAIKIRVLVFSLMKTKKLSLATLSNKIQSVLKKSHIDKLKDGEENDYENNDEISYQKREFLEYYGNNNYYHDDDDKYPDLTHSLFDEDEDDEGSSIIDMVKNCKENEGQDFKLEDEIDHVADLFIKRFRRQILLQKFESFKRIQEMLGRSA